MFVYEGTKSDENDIYTLSKKSAHWTDDWSETFKLFGNEHPTARKFKSRLSESCLNSGDDLRGNNDSASRTSPSRPSFSLLGQLAREQSRARRRYGVSYNSSCTAFSKYSSGCNRSHSSNSSSVMAAM